jgi:hypothetical protein
MFRLAGVTCLVLSLSLFGNAGDMESSDSNVKELSLADYQQELSRIDQGLKDLVEQPTGADQLRSSIAEKWKVNTPSGVFEIDNVDLRYGLTRYSGKTAKRGEILPKLEFKVEEQLRGAREFERPTDGSAHTKLQTILQSREYRNLKRTESPLDRLKDMLFSRVIDLLSRFFRLAAAHPRISRAFLWSIIGLVIAGFVVWLYFLLRSTARDEYAFPQGGAGLFPSAKAWQQWLKEAQAAAERGDWRDAVHLAYWGAISYLELSGAWKPDRARTPREYLRMFKPQSGQVERREPLEALTRRFEFVWYAQQTASPEDYQFTLAQLDKIGCR